MAGKTFQEILQETIGAKEAPKAVAPGAKAFTIVPEFNLSAVQLGPSVFRVKASSAYRPSERPPAKPATQPQAAPRPAPPADKIIATADLSEADKRAIRALEITDEPFLSKNEVKAKHRALVRKFHPDRHADGLSDLERRLLTEKFQLIQESYERLEQAFRRHNPKQQ